MALKIVVLAKQVPDTRNVGKDAVTAEGTVNRAALPAIFNPEDLNALEQALRLKEQNPGSTVGILTMGPPRAGEIIRQGLYRGADTGWLLTDRLFAGADTLATSYALATAIKKIGDVDIVIGGRQAIDGDTAQVGPQISEHLNIPVISYAEEIKVDGDSVIVKRQFDDRYHMLKAKMPCLITALSELNKPRYMTPGGILDAFNAEITVWSRDDLKTLDDSNMGLKGSPTQIAKASDKVAKGAGEKFVPDSANDAAQFIISKLAEKHVI